MGYGQYSSPHHPSAASRDSSRLAQAVVSRGELPPEFVPAASTVVGERLREQLLAQMAARAHGNAAEEESAHEQQ
jgi:hypothetical protein